MDYDYDRKFYIINMAKTIDYSLTPQMAAVLYAHFKVATAQFSNELAMPMTATAFKSIEFNPMQEVQDLLATAPFTMRPPKVQPSLSSGSIVECVALAVWRRCAVVMSSASSQASASASETTRTT